MPETFTFEDLIESEAGKFTPSGTIKEVVKTATTEQESILDNIVPAEWKKPIGKLIENFADHPERFQNTILGGGGGGGTRPPGKSPGPAPAQTQPAQTQTAPITPPIAAPEQTPEQNLKPRPDFETLYRQLTEGVEKVIELQGDMPLSEILKELKEETYKPLLEQMFNSWM
ncbi:MAG: hypothetical protein LBU81_02805 [Methanosarcinales archaeon]|jgi:hypothetical protein|nr:hypothetical protein [Methanosarcinales archaeon]